MKIDRSREKKSALILAVTVIVVLAIFVGVALALKQAPKVAQSAVVTNNPSQNMMKTPGYAEIVEPLNTVYLDNLHGAKVDKFWLQGNEDMHTWIQVTQAWKAKVIGLMKKFKDVDVMTAKVVHSFPDFTLTEFENWRSKQNYEGTVTEAEIKAALSRLEVCVVSKQQETVHKLPSHVYYNLEWRALMVVAINIPDSFLIALIYHELGHAHKHRIENAASATADGLSDLWISEEVEMHQVENQVLTLASNGQLAALYDKIAARAKSATPIVLLGNIQVQDFVEYDRIFGLTEAGPIMANVYLAQFYMGLGFHAIDQKVPETERTTAKIAFYRWLVNKG